MRRLVTAVLVLFLVGSGAAQAAAPTSVSVKDRTGDIDYVDGLPTSASSRSIDITRVSFAKQKGSLRIVTTVREGSTSSTLAQYAVAYATNPKTGVTFLFQVDTSSGRLVYIAQQSWANPVDCDRARGTVLRGRPGRFTATVPLSCLGNPARLTGFSAYTVAERYDIATSQWLVLAEDTTATSKAVLRLR